MNKIDLQPLKAVESDGSLPATYRIVCCNCTRQNLYFLACDEGWTFDVNGEPFVAFFCQLCTQYVREYSSY